MKFVEEKFDKNLEKLSETFKKILKKVFISMTRYFEFHKQCFYF